MSVDPMTIAAKHPMHLLPHEHPEEVMVWHADGHRSIVRQSSRRCDTSPVHTGHDRVAWCNADLLEPPLDPKLVAVRVSAGSLLAALESNPGYLTKKVRRCMEQLQDDLDRHALSAREDGAA